MPATHTVGACPSVVAVARGVNVAQPLTTASTSNNGVDSITFRVSASGLYRITSVLGITQQSNAATSDVGLARMTYNNGTAQADKTIAANGVVPGTYDLKGSAVGTPFLQTATIYAVANSDITVSVLDTVTGGKTAGRWDVLLTIEQL